MYKKKHIKGFTLVEVLIAIFIFSIIITTVFTAYRSMFSNIEAIDVGIENREMAKNCLDRITNDLQSIFIYMPPLYKTQDFNSPPNPYRIVGDSLNNSSRLRFASLSHLSVDNDKRKSIAEIVYYVSKSENDIYVLRRSDTLEPYKAFAEKKSHPVLCYGVKSLTIKYFDIDGKEFDDWDSESDSFKYSTPKAVLIKLEIKNGSASFWAETKISLPIYREKLNQS